MKKFFQTLKGIFQKLNLIDKAQADQLSEEEWKNIAQEYEAQNPGRNFDTDLATALKEENDAKALAEQQRSQILAIANRVLPASNESENNGGESENEGSPKPSDNVDPVAIVQKMADAIESMAARANHDKAEDETKPVFNINGPGTNKTHFLGIAHSMFSLDKRWNKIAANTSYATQNPTPTAEDFEEFTKEYRAFGLSLSQRYAYLKENNMLDAKRLMAFENDYSGLDPANLPDYYLIRRQDALIARLITMYNIYDVFPRRYGVQDREVMFSAFFDTVSQAWQEGEVFKGKMDLQPELAYVDDAMIKLKFKPMKEIERMYIGYLNTEGSDPMKWSLIEWQILNVMTQAISEQNHRRIMGVYVHPETGIPGHYLNSSTGIVYTLIRYAHEFKLKIHDDSAYMGYTDSTFLETVQDMLEEIKLDITEDYTVPFEKLSVILNTNHKLWWKKNCRAKYGKDLDFTGPDSMMNKVPDIDTPIIWLPNLGNLPFILVQEPGNLQCIEYLPGEMLALQFERAMEVYKAWSVWKEGTSASFIGQKFSTKAAMDNNNFLRQRVFMNKPASYLADGATTINGANGFWFVTQANTAATALTDIANIRPGVAYILEIGSTTNATTIARTGKFSELSAAFSPTAVGDYIMLVPNSDKTKFFELERMVGGVRTINAALQPNVPGVR
ncbi:MULTISPECIES: hypothetical protein [unclassified Dysgonomonas]|uniref:hypothetical protein n=1 Tax=unclassified Dysgonomonas TaxID=2630389 RepID=UPI0025BB543D|nr:MULTISPECIES: hypothetical protein [unclassified Dysgonomonas]HMM02021.1 hypothetical protein [Dysgonomonas sp.]